MNTLLKDSGNGGQPSLAGGLKLHAQTLFQIGACFGYGAPVQPQRKLGADSYGRSITIGNDTWTVLNEIREIEGVKRPGMVIMHHINGAGGGDRKMERWWVPYEVCDEVEVGFKEVYEI
jgi:hypothetical protein